MRCSELELDVPLRVILLISQLWIGGGRQIYLDCMGEKVAAVACYSLFVDGNHAIVVHATCLVVQCEMRIGEKFVLQSIIYKHPITLQACGISRGNYLKFNVAERTCLSRYACLWGVFLLVEMIHISKLVGLQELLRGGIESVFFHFRGDSVCKRVDIVVLLVQTEIGRTIWFGNLFI